jgi:acetoin utilization protein AcuB
MALVSEAMSRAVVTVPADTRVSDAAEVVRRTGAEHLLVLDGENVVGVLCTCDLDGAAPEELVCDRMSLPVMTVRPDAALEEAAMTMRECEVGCLPVCCGGLLLGIVGDAELEAAGVPAPRAKRRCHHRHGSPEALPH